MKKWIFFHIFILMCICKPIQTIPHFTSISFTKACKATPNIGYKPDTITPDNKWAIAQNIYDTQIKQIQKSEKPYIPKVIHQIWLGSPLPEKCINLRPEKIF